MRVDLGAPWNTEEITKLGNRVLTAERERDDARAEVARLRAEFAEVEAYLGDRSLSAAQIVQRLRVRIGRAK